MQHPAQPITPELINDIETVLGRAGLDVRIPETGMWKSTFIVSDGDQHWVVRIMQPPALRLRRGLMAQRKAAATGVKVPELIHESLTESPNHGLLWTIEAFMDGQSYYPSQLDREICLSAARDMGLQLSRLHTIRVGAFGPLNTTLDGPMDNENPHSWQGWLNESEEKFKRSFDVAQMSPHGQTAIREALARLRDFDPGLPRLCHGDFADDNLIIRDGKLAAVIDWNNVIGCDPAFDLAYGYLWHNDTECFDALLESYARSTGDDLESLRRRTLDHRLVFATWLIDWCTGQGSLESRAHIISVLKKITGEV